MRSEDRLARIRASIPRTARDPPGLLLSAKSLDQRGRLSHLELTAGNDAASVREGVGGEQHGKELVAEMEGVRLWRRV